MDNRYILLYFFLHWNTLVYSTAKHDVFIHQSMNLTDAITHCRDLGGELVEKNEIFCKNIPNLNTLYSDSGQTPITVWTGSFRTFSAWISLLGCFNIVNDGHGVHVNTLEECQNQCVQDGRNMFAHNKFNNWCECNVENCTTELENIEKCRSPSFNLLGGVNTLFVYKVRKTLPFVNVSSNTCYAQVMDGTESVHVSSKCYSRGYTMKSDFTDIANINRTCVTTGQNKIIYHFRNAINDNARNGTKEQLLSFNRCQMIQCIPQHKEALEEGRCNDSAAGFFCKIDVQPTTLTTQAVTTTSRNEMTSAIQHSLTSTNEETDVISTTNDIQETTNLNHTTSDWLSTEHGNKTKTSSLLSTINTLSTDDTSPQTETTSDKSLLVSTTSNSSLYSESSKVSTVSSTSEIITTTDTNFLSSETYNSDAITVKYSSLSEAFSTNVQPVIGHSSSVTETSESANKVSFVSTDLQLPTTKPRQEITSKEPSTVSTAETSTEPDGRSSSGPVAITTDDSSSVVSTTNSAEIGSTTGISSVTFVNVDATHESTYTKPRDQSTGTVSNAIPQSPNKTEKAIGVEVIAGASSGVAVLIVLIIIIVVVKKRHVKPQKSDTDDFLEKNRYNSYGGIPQSNDYHDITINNKSNTPFHDNNGYALVDRNFLHSNDSVGKRTSGDIHIPRPQIENRSASIYSDKSEQVSLPSEENEGFYDHIQRGEKPRHSTTENAYGCYDEDSPYDITSHSQQKLRQSNYTNVQW